MMKIMARTKVLSAISFLMLSAILIGQSDEKSNIPCLEQLPNEKVGLFTDRDYYLTADKLWFKAHIFLNGELSSDWSKVLYVELYNDQKDVVVQNKYGSKEGLTYGVLEIPEDINSGNYFLRAYTQYGRNFPIESFFTKVISIVNPNSETSFIEVDELQSNSSAKAVDWGERENLLPITLSLSKKQYSRREKVELKISANTYADLVVSVRKKGTSHSQEDLKQFIEINPWLTHSYREKNAEQFIEKSRDSKLDSSITMEWIPEMRGMTLSGKILNKTTGEALPNEYCITSIIGDETQIHLDKTNDEGKFIFSYYELQEEKDIFVALRNNHEKDFEILINKDFSTSFPKLQALALPYDSIKHQIFEELYINQQLNRTFTSENKQNAYQESSPLIPTFNIGLADLSLKLKDFIYIPTMLEVFRELVPLVSVRGKKGNRKLGIFDKETSVSYDNPLVLLDNIPISDIESLLQIEPSKLKGIEVFYSNYLLGDYTIGGIISLKSNQGEFAGFRWTDNSVFLTYKTLEPGITFQSPYYSSLDSKNNRKPDFRTLLYWNPEIQLNEDPISLSFYSSDHISDYEVLVSGFNKEGHACFGRAEFQVVK